MTISWISRVAFTDLGELGVAEDPLIAEHHRQLAVLGVPQPSDSRPSGREAAAADAQLQARGVVCSPHPVRSRGQPRRAPRLPIEEAAV
jgi:hypothetical protein